MCAPQRPQKRLARYQRTKLCAAAQALGRAFARIQPLSLWLCALGALGLLLVAAFFGMDVLLCVSPLLLLPEGILLVWSFVKK